MKAQNKSSGNKMCVQPKLILNMYNLSTEGLKYILCFI